ILRISKTVATQKILALAEAGLRLTLGQTTPDALRDLGFDFYGGSPFDPGFDQLLRSTEAGHQLSRALGAALADASALAGGANTYERSVADIAASGPDVVTFAIGNGTAGAPLDVTFTDAFGDRTVQESAGTLIPQSEVPGAVLLPLGSPAS